MYVTAAAEIRKKMKLNLRKNIVEIYYLRRCLVRCRHVRQTAVCTALHQISPAAILCRQCSARRRWSDGVSPGTVSRPSSAASGGTPRPRSGCEGERRACGLTTAPAARWHVHRLWWRNWQLVAISNVFRSSGTIRGLFALVINIFYNIVVDVGSLPGSG